ncbi:MAG: DUF2075 domain-containing protein [Acholeplasmataceae bacterium]|nr:DUF2075 domain-containing protein [Acholeplasmataceae bacterium]
MPFVADALNDNEIDKSINVAIEYKLDVTNNRIDVLIYGNDSDNKGSLVIVELKQWDYVKDSNKPNYVFTHGGGGSKDYFHPSYQSFRYGSILEGFNEYIQDNDVLVKTCSFLHNMENIYEFSISNVNKYPFVAKSPIFLKDDSKKLNEFVKKYVKKGNRRLLYEIDNSRIRPSKEFSTIMTNAIAGQEIFTLDDNQATAVSTIVDETTRNLEHNRRSTIIIKGGPGTGKSVVAINAMGQLLNPKNIFDRFNVCYVTPNFTPKALFSEILVDNDYRKSAISNLFKSMAAFSNSSEFDYDCIIVDESHRAFTWKFGYGVKKDVDMIDKIFYASRVNVFFIDEQQKVTKDDFLTIERIKQYAKKYNSEVIETDELVLNSQFRVTGGINYINFIDSFLGYENILSKYDSKNYDFKVFDSPTKMWKEIKEKQNEYKDTRLLAGYTHEWVSKQNDDEFDFMLEDGKFKMQWNKQTTTPFILDQTQNNRIGSIHTIQGVDMDYAGVIIGKDIIYRNGEIKFVKENNATSDRASGIRTATDEEAKEMIRNTYKVLLTRAVYGTYVYCEDKQLNEHLKSFLINRD